MADNARNKVEKFKLRDFFKNLEKLKSLRVVVITTVLIVATNYTGLNNFVYRSFKNMAGIEEAHRLTIVYRTIQVLLVCLSLFLLEKFKHYTYLLNVTALCFCSHVVCAVLQYIHAFKNGEKLTLYPWLILACNSLYTSLWLAVLLPLFSIIV